MRSLRQSIFALGFVLAGAAGCGDMIPAATCGSCEGIASKQNPPATASCCGRGCVITDKKCPSGYHYVSGDGKSLAGCAPMDECFYPDMNASVDLSVVDGQ